MKSNLTNVFVYGTLKAGKLNHRIIEGNDFLGEDYIQGFDLFCGGGFPWIVPSEASDTLVKGEVYEVDDETLERLDRLEGYSNGYTGFYDRTEVVTTEGKTVLVYFMHDNSRNGRPVPSGDWNYGIEWMIE